MKTEDLRAQVLDKLKWLRLPGMAASLEALIDRAQKNNLTALEAIDQLLDEERRSRIGRSVDRRIKNARFPELNTVDGFDFDFDPARKKLRARYLALHDLGFLRHGINPLFIGVPGTGKTFLARALAYKACQGQKRVVLVSAPQDAQSAHRRRAPRQPRKRYPPLREAPSSSSSTTSPSSLWIPLRPSSPSRSSPSATTTAAQPPSPPTVPSGTGPKSFPIPSMHRSSPNA